MAKIKNTGNQPRGFYDDQGNQHTVPPGGEIEINMTPADYEKCQEVAKSEDPPLYEISGGAGGKAPTESISASGERVEHKEEKPAPKR